MRQYMRIEANTDGSRLNRAFQAAQRHISNIKKQKSYQNIRGGVTANENIDQYFNNLGKARRIQYSRNTYMGINAG